MKMTEEEWKKFASMTEDEIEAAIASDPDSQAPVSEEFFSSGRFVYTNDNQIILPIKIDAQVASFINTHHLDYQNFVAGVLKAYVESQKDF